MTDIKRVRRAINWLISQGVFPSQKEIGLRLGIANRSYLSQLVNSEVPNKEFVNKFIKIAPMINRDWLLTGEGNMLVGEQPKSNATLIGGVFGTRYEDEGVVMVDFIPVAATATFACSLGENRDYDIEKFPLVPYGNERNEVKDLRIFEVEGDSMYPTIASGSLILAKVIPQNSWHYAEGVVVAVFSDYIVVKRVARNALLSENCIVLSSDNESYGEITVPLSDLRGLFRAKRIISSVIR